MNIVGKFRFLLYIAGDGPNSTRAMANLKALCREHLPDRHEIVIIDVVQNPQRALDDDVLLTPTLVKILPKPVRTIIGNLSDAELVLQTLGIKPRHE